MERLKLNLTLGKITEYWRVERGKQIQQIDCYKWVSNRSYITCHCAHHYSLSLPVTLVSVTKRNILVHFWFLSTQTHSRSIKVKTFLKTDFMY